MDPKYPYGIFNQDPENITYGTGTQKAADQLARFRASLRAQGDIVGGEPRLVSDTTPAGWPASRYGADGFINSALMERDFNDAYLEGRKLGLSDRDAIMVARMRIGQQATQEVEGRPGVRQAINETEMSDLRRVLSAQAAETITPYVGPDYREQKPGSIPQAVQQMESAPIPRAPSGRRMALRYGGGLLGGLLGIYGLAEVTKPPERELQEVA